LPGKIEVTPGVGCGTGTVPEAGLPDPAAAIVDIATDTNK
jgi:hypothetical protein